MSERPRSSGDVPDVDAEALVSAVLTASRVLVAVAARSPGAAEDAVTLPQLRLMVVLATRGPMKLAAVAGELAVNASTALRMVERLTSAGMVSRAANPASRREIQLDLTIEGRRVVDAVTARRRADITAIVGRMQPTDRERLVAALQAFANAAGEPPANGG